MGELMRRLLRLSSNDYYKYLFDKVKNDVEEPRSLEESLRLFCFGFQPLTGTSIPLDTRRKLFDTGACAFLFDILAKYPEDIQIHFWCWKIFHDAICIYDNDQIEEFETVDRGIDLGVLEWIAAEVSRQPPRPRILSDVFSVLTTICMVSKHAEIIIAAGIVESCLDLAENRDMSLDISTSTLGSLKNLAMSEVSATYLKNDRVIALARSKLHLLESENAPQVKLGLCAASLIIRVVGPDDAGMDEEMADFLFQNEQLFAKLAWLLQSTLEVGPTGTVLDSGWNPANIVLDISILAAMDENKHALVEHVKVLAESLQRRGLGNARLVKYSVQALASLRQEKLNNAAFDVYSTQLRNALETLNAHTCLDLKTFQDITVLLSTLKESHHRGETF
jgi:hypothetical protein